MEVKKVMEKVVEPTSIHTLNITVLVTPGKRLLTDNSVHWCQLRDIRIIYKLTILRKTHKIQAHVKNVISINFIIPYLCGSESEDNQPQDAWCQKSV